MTTIKLYTQIDAPVEKVFDLSRDIDFHIRSASQTHEKAIDGRTSGLISYGETVTWRGRHFGIFLRHTSKIVSYERPYRFTDVMIKGHFKYFAHQHIFRSEGGGTLMIDVLTYRVPFGYMGSLFDQFVLRKHLSRFLEHRNQAIKVASEENSSKRSKRVS